MSLPALLACRNGRAEADHVRQRTLTAQTASCHCPPFSHLEMAALKLITSSSKLPLRKLLHATARPSRMPRWPR
eukprot:10123179-Karenia_brevis.AAC.1